MLYIKDLSFFRQYYKSQEALNFDRSIDTSFINTFHPEKPANKTKGFSYLVYGARGNIGGFLRSASLNVAADQQAIYELIQNADDCEANLFSVFYNREYLLCINNGIPFSKRNMSAILNVGDSDKDAEDIGTFGIGFKIIHRLLGEDDGLKAILNDYAGPIIFSWNQYNHLKRLLNDEEILINKNGSRDEDCPWLLKIIYTCFPTHLGENIKNEKYSDETLFPIEEFNEFKSFLKGSLSKLNTFTENNLRQGSIFFLRIGADKFKYIDENIENIFNGIGYSFNFLNHLKRIYINEKEINKEKITLEKFEYSIGSEQYNYIRPRNEERNIDFSFSYYKNYKTALKLKEVPNIYNFFSMEEEKNGWCFLLHCNSFDMHNDRRKLQPNSNINERLLPYIANDIKQFSLNLSDTNTELFRNLYPSLLLSDIPDSKPHLRDYFFDKLTSILSERIPTDEGFSDNTQNVVIKKTKLPISPRDWGVEKDWFYWTDFKEDEAIIKEAQKEEKLNLEKWDLQKLIEFCNITDANANILQLYNNNRSAYEILIEELNQVTEYSWKANNSSLFSKFKLLSLFPYIKNEQKFLVSYEYCINNNIYILQSKHYKLFDILTKLKILVSTQSVEKELSSIGKLICENTPYINEENKFFEIITEQTKVNGKLLSNVEKKDLFTILKTFRGVDKSKLRQIHLFKNNTGDIPPLCELITKALKLESWILKYQILEDEFFDELDDYLVQQNEIYPFILYPKWDEIIKTNSFTNTNISDFYSSVKTYFDEETINSLILNKKAYIYTSEGFFLTSDVFYHEVFNSIMDYSALKSSIEKVTGFKTPSKKVLTYLTENPFKTDNDKLLDYLSDCSLEKPEAYELLRYCQKAEVKLFSKGVFFESGNDIDWECNDSKIQYFSEDSRLIEFINEYLEDTFYLLPSVLKDFKSFEGIRRNQELYVEIIEQLENINDLAVEFLPLLKHKEVIKSYLTNLPEIRIENKSSFDKSSFEYIVISNIIAHFEDEELEEIKERIIICDEDTEFKLEEIVTGNEVRFEIDDKIYNIKVSEILPESDNFSKAEILETIVANLKRLELPSTKIDILLSIEIEENDLAEKLADELFESLENSTLETAEQIAFCLLYEIQSGWSKFDDFKIYASNNETYKLNDVWYAKPFSFLSETGAIGEQYKGLSKLLKIKDENPIFKVSDSCIFLYKPAFDEDGNFICNYIDENLDDSRCVDLLNFLFEEYNKRGKESRRDFEEIDDWSKLGDTETEKILGFSPHNTILIENDEFVLSDEVAPYWIQEWAKDEANISFLKVLGIHFDDSDIVKFRMSLIADEVLISTKEIEESNSLFDYLLDNTLKWIKEAEIWKDKVIREAEKIGLIRALTAKLGWDKNDNWYIDSNRLESESEEWDDAGYENWCNEYEYESFEVRLYDGQMPCYLEYNSHRIAEENEDDYWFDKENSIFYVNKNKSIELLLQNAAEEKIFETDIKPLINKGLAKVNELERKVRELERENNDLKSTPDRTPKKTDKISKEDQERANLEARIAVKKFLQLNASEGYDVSCWDPYNSYAYVERKVKKNGEYIDIVAKCAKWGDIFLAANEFELLCQDAKNQLFVYNGYDVKPVTLNSIFEANSLIQLQIDTNHINGKFLGMLAKAFQYVTNTKFVVEDPNHSAHNLLNRLGMNNLNEGFISASFDDEY